MFIRDFLKKNRIEDNFDIRAPNLIGQDEVEDKEILYKRLVSNKIRSKKFNSDKPFYGITMTEGVAVTLQEAAAAGIKWPMLSETEPDAENVIYKCKVWLPIDKNGGFIVDQNQLANVEDQQEAYKGSLENLREFYMHPMIFGLNATIPANKVVKVIYEDQKQKTGFIIGASNFYQASREVRLIKQFQPATSVRRKFGPGEESESTGIIDFFKGILYPEQEEQIPTMEIYYQAPLDLHIPYLRGKFVHGNSPDPKLIIIHVTVTSEEDSGAESTIRGCAPGGGNPATVHFAVSKTNIWQGVPDGSSGAHIGSPRYLDPIAIGIEHVGRVNDDKEGIMNQKFLDERYGPRSKWAAEMRRRGRSEKSIQREREQITRIRLGKPFRSLNDWNDEFSLRMLNLSAKLVALLCHQYGIKPTHLTNSELAAGFPKGATAWNPQVTGIVDHAAINQVFGVEKTYQSEWGGRSGLTKSSHYDVGYGFPWDYYMDRINLFYNYVQLRGGQILTYDQGTDKTKQGYLTPDYRKFFEEEFYPIPDNYVQDYKTLETPSQTSTPE